ncbi:hypothetical protein D3C76_821100 [compost metagenome]
MAFNADKTNCFNLNFLAVSKYSYKTTGQVALFHVQLANKVLNLTFSEIKNSAVDRYINSDPVRAVKHFGEIFRVSVFPPAYACFVGIVYTCHVTALQGFTAVLLFKISTLSHVPVTDTENTFRNLMCSRIKGFFNNGPFINF